ncbi:MAG: phosphoglycerate mutase, partial [Methanomicrobiales archaeon]|nr:phosphoglycerate mutase [Methanomicrobiales archaeon]
GVIAVLPDHPTPIRLRTHTADPVPFAVRGLSRDSIGRLTEREAAKGSFGLRNGMDLLPLMLGRGTPS